MRGVHYDILSREGLYYYPLAPVRDELICALYGDNEYRICRTIFYIPSKLYILENLYLSLVYSLGTYPNL